MDKEGKYFRWTYNLAQSELVSSIKEKCELTAINILELIPLKTGDSGRIIDLEIKYSDEAGKTQSVVIHSEYEIRNI